MRSGRQVALATVVFTCVSALPGGIRAQAAQQLECELAVASSAQFCPAPWRAVFARTPAATERVLVHEAPRLDFEMWGAVEQRWLRPQEWGDSRERGLYHPVRGMAGFVVGESGAALRGAIEDWRVIGFPGRYRVRIVWSEGVPRDKRWDYVRALSDWVELTVVEMPGSGATLAEAKASNSETWTAYCAFMDKALDLAAVAGGGADSLVVSKEHLRQGVPERDDLEVLGGAAGLPPIVRARVELAQCLKELRLGRAREGPQGSQMLLSAYGRAEGVGVAADGYYSRLAGIARFAVLRARGQSATAESLAEALHADPGSRECVVGRPGLAEALWPSR